MSTTINLGVNLDLGAYGLVEDCYLAMVLEDKDQKTIYGLYFDMVSQGNRSSRLIQGSQFSHDFSFFGPVVETEIKSLIKELNTVSVTITKDSYVVELNGRTIEPRVKVEWSRLLAFERIVIKGMGCCLTADLDHSFLDIKEIGRVKSLVLLLVFRL